jgi:hypothetical protein
MMLAQSNPAPLINNPLVPDAAAPGGGSFTLTVNGTGFVSGSVVNWNGSALATNFVTSSQLTATVPASNIASGNTASVTVLNPVPGGGTSNVSFFGVRQPFPVVGFGQSTLSSVNFPYQVITLDANGDGKLDLAATVLDDSAISILLGNGDGTFQPPATYSANGFPFAIVAGDFNGDGKIDLAFSSITSDQSTGFVSVLLGNGDGSFQSANQEFDVGTNPLNLVTADFNNDGKLDLAVAVAPPGSGTPVVAILMGNGDGTFQGATDYSFTTGVADIKTGDFNGDGKLDLVAAIVDGVSVMLGNGDGTFQPPVNYPTAVQSESVVTADFNRDGRLDLAVQAVAGKGAVSILLGNGDGTFQNHVDYQLSGIGLVAADLNGDGVLDLATSNGTVSTLIGNSNGTFARAPGYFPASSAAFGIAAGDFNGDGRTDIVTADGSGNTISILPQSISVLSQTFLNFGDVKIGKGKSIKVGLANIGNSAFSISSISITGSFAADFSERNNCGSSLGPGATCVIGVAFKPQTHAQMTAAVTVVDSGVVGSQTITLKGNGVK